MTSPDYLQSTSVYLVHLVDVRQGPDLRILSRRENFPAGRGGLVICASWKSPEWPSGLRLSTLFNNKNFHFINYQQVALIGQPLFHRPKSQQRRLTLVSVNRKMASRKRSTLTTTIWGESPGAIFLVPVHPCLQAH